MPVLDKLPDPPTQDPALPQLVVGIRLEIEAMAKADGSKLLHAFALGAKLIQAKDQAPGEWEAWLRREFKMKLRLAQTYMQLAQGRKVIDAQSSARPINSIDAALRFLRKCSGTTRSVPEAKAARKPRTVSPSSLDWSNATLEERRRLLDGAGLRSVLEALPPTWRTQIEDRILGQIGALQLIEALEGKVADKTAREALEALRQAMRSPPITIEADRNSIARGPDAETGADRAIPDFLHRAAA